MHKSNYLLIFTVQLREALTHNNNCPMIEHTMNKFLFLVFFCHASCSNLYYIKLIQILFLFILLFHLCNTYQCWLHCCRIIHGSSSKSWVYVINSRNDLNNFKIQISAQITKTFDIIYSKYFTLQEL
jgi:hypothetical protein